MTGTTENKVQTYRHDVFGELRTIGEKDGEIWFVGKDVAEHLGYKRARDAISAHCKGAVKHRLPTNSGAQDITLIPERDVYRLVMRSKLPAAQQFEEWVVGEVLPSIRKTGSYSVLSNQLPDFANPADAARAWAIEYEAKEKAEAESKRLNAVCNELSRQFVTGVSIPSFCMQLNGVNTREINAYLQATGWLVKTKRGWRAAAKGRDSYFKTSIGEFNGKERFNVEVTERGASWLCSQYLKKKLPMKKTWDGKLSHSVFQEIKTA